MFKEKLYSFKKNLYFYKNNMIATAMAMTTTRVVRALWCWSSPDKGLLGASPMDTSGQTVGIIFIEPICFIENL